MKKVILISLLTIIMVSTIFAGASKEKKTESETNISLGTKTTFPFTFKDQIGNSVTVNKPVKRLVSGYYISSSSCIALGLKNIMVGVEEKIEKRPIYKLSAPELIGNTTNVGSAKAFNLEACISEKPDLVILPKKAKDYAKTLTEMGIPAMIVNPESHEQLVEMILLIGKLTGTEDRADKLVERYNQITDRLEKITSDIKDENKPVVYMCGTNSYLTTAPKNMYQASLITSAGGINAGNGLDGDSWTNVSYEQILTMNPDVIIIPTNSMADGQPDFNAEQIIADKNLSEIKAVKTRQIYNMPAGFEAWDSPVPSGVLGMLWLTAKLHPQAYSMEEFISDATDFYRTFYDFEMDTSKIK